MEPKTSPSSSDPATYAAADQHGDTRAEDYAGKNVRGPSSSVPNQCRGAGWLEPGGQINIAGV